MAINTVIQERRKALGLTQEQVAEYLGVTTTAVNKWEKGSTCPDIALLPPLARLLKIDLNTMFGFYEDITHQELILLCKEIHEKVISDGFDTGFSIAQEKIREYPNSNTLLHNLALQLQGLLATAGLDEVQSIHHSLWNPFAGRGGSYAMIIIRLDRVLADRKMKLNDLAAQVGISNVNLSYLKTGKVKAVRFSTLDAICKVLKCQPGDILEYVEDDN